MKQVQIMIIDDDVDLSMLIEDMLLDEGYSVLHCTSMEDAYEKLEKETPQLILLDINLPDGTGFSLCQELRKRSKVPIIFASARTSEEDRINGLEIGGDDYLSKPYSLRELMSRIRSLLRRSYSFAES
ncbi:MAG: response regulator transcription factor, partial [Lachnospiraceae bacterium]|nr:response regulator transcription factor [Lachnospiraceae bacterium]